MKSKAFWTSRTLWVALISFISILMMEAKGIEIGASTQAAILSVIMVVMRAITKQPLGLTDVD